MANNCNISTNSIMPSKVLPVAHHEIPINKPPNGILSGLILLGKFRASAQWSLKIGKYDIVEYLTRVSSEHFTSSVLPSLKSTTGRNLCSLGLRNPVDK
jgi:hypothetical protein